MADSKKYDGSQWEHSLRKLTTAIEAVENPLYSDGTAITSYTIKGNTVQSGTPTPSNPVEVQGVGNKTANLFDKDRTQGIIANAYINQSGQQVSSQNYYLSYPITVTEGEIYTWSFSSDTGAQHTSPTAAFYDNNDTLIGVATHNSAIYHFTFTIPANCAYIRTSVYNGAAATFTPMLIVGTTLIPNYRVMDYIPYGYKIPISTAQGSAVNYLGSVSSNRQIAKYEFTGLETFYNKSSTYQGSFYVSWASLGGKRNQMFLCDRAENVSSISNYAYGKCYSDSSMNLWLGEASWSTQDFKDYLAEQYASGTPVTIYYVLNEATTGIVNEPLQKIGDYADSIANATAIPTTEGANTITVDTTVQPSEFTATWTGWHDSSVKEYDGSNWQ